MSLDTKINIPEQIKKYLKKFPTLTRPLLQTLIRLEYENSARSKIRINQRHEQAFLKQLNRELDKAFSKKTKNGTQQLKPQTKKPSESNDLDTIENYAVDEDISRAWNKLVFYADKNNMKPHPKDLYNQMEKSAEEEYGTNYIDFNYAEWDLNTKMQIVRTLLKEYRNQLSSRKPDSK